MHAVTCQRSGAISRGHSALRDTVAELLTRDGISTVPEQRLPNSLDRPADLLVSSWHGCTMALDFTIITPTRASASPFSSSTTTLLDQAAKQKQQKSRQQCEAAGWRFQPFVADTYGALHAEAREFVSNFISRYHSKFAPSGMEHDLSGHRAVPCCPAALQACAHRRSLWPAASCASAPHPTLDVFDTAISSPSTRHGHQHPS